MGKIEATIKPEIIRLSKREMRKVSVPLSRDVRLLKGAVSKLRKTVLELERIKSPQEKGEVKTKNRLAASPDEVKSSRFSPRLIRSLRKRLGITQRELAALTGVTIGAAHLWETGKFLPSDEKRGVIVALRKLRRRDVRELLDQKRVGKTGT